MAKLYFYYAAMNSGKSTLLLQSNFNYEERKMQTIIFIPKLIQNKNINSRIGLKKEAINIDESFDFYKYLQDKQNISCIMIDEAQFLKKQQVLDLCHVVDKLNIPVLCYGLRSDFLGEPFEGSKYLLTLADKLIELKTMCYCGKKATMNLRIKKDCESFTSVVKEGPQIEIGGNDKYISLCRKCYYETMN